MSALRVGIVGAGGIVKQRHLPGLQAIPGVEIVAIANSSLESSRRFCEEHVPAAEPMADWQDLVSRSALDVVWIGAHPNLHKPVTLAALAAGKHVFCQARMARDLTEAREMLAAAEAHPELVTMLCPPPYGLRYDAFVKNLLRDDLPGAIHHLRLESLNGLFLDPDKPPHWRQRREISGLNYLTLGIYAEVLQRWFGGIAGVRAVGKILNPERAGYRIEIPDQLDVLAQFENGIVGSLQFSGVHSGPPVDRLTVTGRKGVLVYDFAKEILTLETPETSQRLDVPPRFDRPWQVEQDFIDAVRNPSAPRPHPDFPDGVAYMRVVQMVHEALRSPI